MLELKGLSKSYEQKPVFSNVFINLQEPVAAVLAGAKGSGKSSLLRCMAGVDAHFEGQVLLDGVDVRSQELESRLFYVPENPNLQGEQRVSDYLAQVAKERKLSNWQHRAEILLRRLHLSEAYDWKFKDMDNAQRICIVTVACLISQCDWNFFDQILDQLPPVIREEMIRLLWGVQQTGKNFVVSASNLKDAMAAVGADNQNLNHKNFGGLSAFSPQAPQAIEDSQGFWTHVITIRDDGRIVVKTREAIVQAGQKLQLELAYAYGIISEDIDESQHERLANEAATMAPKNSDEARFRNIITQTGRFDPNDPKAVRDKSYEQVEMFEGINRQKAAGLRDEQNFQQAQKAKHEAFDHSDMSNAPVPGRAGNNFDQVPVFDIQDMRNAPPAVDKDRYSQIEKPEMPEQGNNTISTPFTAYQRRPIKGARAGHIAAGVADAQQGQAGQEEKGMSLTDAERIQLGLPPLGGATVSAEDSGQAPSTGFKSAASGSVYQSHSSPSSSAAPAPAASPAPSASAPAPAAQSNYKSTSWADRMAAAQGKPLNTASSGSKSPSSGAASAAKKKEFKSTSWADRVAQIKAQGNIPDDDYEENTEQEEKSRRGGLFSRFKKDAHHAPAAKPATAPQPDQYAETGLSSRSHAYSPDNFQAPGMADNTGPTSAGNMPSQVQAQAGYSDAERIYGSHVGPAMVGESKPVIVGNKDVSFGRPSGNASPSSFSQMSGGQPASYMQSQMPAADSAGAFGISGPGSAASHDRMPSNAPAAGMPQSAASGAQEASAAAAQNIFPGGRSAVGAQSAPGGQNQATLQIAPGGHSAFTAQAAGKQNMQNRAAVPQSPPQAGFLPPRSPETINKMKQQAAGNSAQAAQAKEDAIAQALAAAKAKEAAQAKQREEQSKAQSASAKAAVQDNDFSDLTVPPPKEPKYSGITRMDFSKPTVPQQPEKKEDPVARHPDFAEFDFGGNDSNITGSATSAFASSSGGGMDLGGGDELSARLNSFDFDKLSALTQPSTSASGPANSFGGQGGPFAGSASTHSNSPFASSAPSSAGTGYSPFGSEEKRASNMQESRSAGQSPAFGDGFSARKSAFDSSQGAFSNSSQSNPFAAGGSFTDSFSSQKMPSFNEPSGPESFRSPFENSPSSQAASFSSPGGSQSAFGGAGVPQSSAGRFQSSAGGPQSSAGGPQSSAGAPQSSAGGPNSASSSNFFSDGSFDLSAAAKEFSFGGSSIGDMFSDDDDFTIAPPSENLSDASSDIKTSNEISGESSGGRINLGPSDDFILDTKF